MAQIGTLGDIVFEVSDSVVRTFKDYQRKTSARLATHEIIGQKPVTEFLGPNIDSISFSIKLSAFMRVNPTEEANKLRKIIENGEVVNLIVAGSPVADNKWIVESMDETVIANDGKGNIITSDVAITIQEYVQREDEKSNENN